MTHKKMEYRVYEWLGEECIKSLDEEIELNIVKSVRDCVHFVKGYCSTQGCVPIEVMEHITDLATEGRIA